MYDKDNLIRCEDANGNVEYLTSTAFKLRSQRPNPTAFLSGRGQGKGRAVEAHAPPVPRTSIQAPDADEPGPDKAAPPTAASVIAALKATSTEEEARAVIGADDRKTVLGALAAHLRKIKAQ